MNKRKNVFLLWVFIFIMGVLNLFYITYLKENPSVYRTGEFEIARDEYSFPDILTVPEDYVQQKFVLLYDYLESIRIRLAINYEGIEDEFIIKIQLSNADTIITEQEVSSTEIENWQYYTFEVGKELKAGEEYFLTISQKKGPTVEGTNEYWISYIPFLAPGHVAENAEYYLRNGVSCEGEFETEYVYQVPNKQGVRNLVIFDCVTIVVLIVFMFCFFKYEKLFLQLKKIAIYLFPLISLICVELITENIQDIDFVYWLKNLLIYYAMFFVLQLLFKSQISAAVLAGILGVGAIVYHYVLVFRGSSFVLWDIFAWKTAATVAETYTFQLTEGIVQALWIWAVLLFIVCLGEKVENSFKVRLYSLGCCFVLMGVFAFCARFLRDFSVWDIESNYRDKGLVYTLAAEIPYIINEEPDNYSDKKILEISESIPEKAPKQGTVPENIIFIMNESFSDLSCYQEVKGGEKVLSYWNSLKENVQRGWLAVPIFGAMTANSEYEVLTGNSMSFHTAGSVVYQTSTWEDERQSLASVLNSQGFYSLALHPNASTNWNRAKVYSSLGFKEFVSSENWGESHIIRWCESDESCYSKIMELTQSIEQKTFLFCVTMQNHGGYAGEWEGFSSAVDLDYACDYPQAEQYLTLIQKSDEAIRYLLDYYENCDENTMIVIFGDHQAAIEEELYEELMGEPLEDLTLEEKQKRYMTPFIIWTNYDIEEKEDMYISSNYLGVYALSLANVRQPLYHQFLLNQMQTIPVIGVGGVYDSNGKWYDFSDAPKSVSKLLNEYEILQYNNFYDEDDRVDELFEVTD